MSDKNKLLEYNQTTEKNNFYRTDSKIIQTGGKIFIIKLKLNCLIELYK